MKPHFFNPVTTILATFVFVTFLTSCSTLGRSPDTRFYSISAVKENINTPSSNLKIGIGPVRLPKQLKQADIVTRINQNELKVSEYHQWAGSLKEDITQALTDNLSALLGTQQIEKFPWKRRFNPNYQVRVQIEQMDGEPGKNITLKARWWLRVNNAATDRLAKKSRFTVATKDTDYTSYVAALSTAIGQLSEEIAREIRR